MTIHDLNAAPLLSNRLRDWSGLTLKKELRLGRAGRFALRGRAGSQVHLLDVEVILAHDTNPKQVGNLLSVKGCVSGNGQFTGTVIDGLVDLDAVSCKRCRARIDRLAAAHFPRTEAQA